MKQEDCDLHTAITDKLLLANERLFVAHSLLDALFYLKQVGVLHKDIKTRNILLSGRNARLCDFGMAQKANRPYTMPAYTPGYCPPETRGEYANSNCGYSSEIWALGAVFLSMHFGQTFIQNTDVQLYCLDEMNVDGTDELLTLARGMIENGADERPAVEELLAGELCAPFGRSTVLAPVPTYSRTLGFTHYFAGVIIKAWFALHENKAYNSVAYFISTQLFRSYLGRQKSLPVCLYTAFTSCYAVTLSYLDIMCLNDSATSSDQRRLFRMYCSEILHHHMEWITRDTPYDLLMQMMGGLDTVQEEILMWGCAYNDTATVADDAICIANFVYSLLTDRTRGRHRLALIEFAQTYTILDVSLALTQEATSRLQFMRN